MAYLIPSEFVTKMVDSGESKVYMSAKDTLIRAYMAGAILALAAVFAVTVAIKTGSPLVGAVFEQRPDGGVDDQHGEDKSGAEFSPMPKLISAATSRMRMMGFLNWEKMMHSRGIGGATGRALGPSRNRRTSPSAVLRPLLLSKCLKVVSIPRVWYASNSIHLLYQEIG